MSESKNETSAKNLGLEVLRDVRYGLRDLGRAPGFSFFAILTLALGIGATITVFTVVNSLLLHPLPARDPSRLVCVYTTDLKNSRQAGSVAANLLPESEGLSSSMRICRTATGPMEMLWENAFGWQATMSRDR